MLGCLLHAHQGPSRQRQPFSAPTYAQAAEPPWPGNSGPLESSTGFPCCQDYMTQTSIAGFRLCLYLSSGVPSPGTPSQSQGSALFLHCVSIHGVLTIGPRSLTTRARPLADILGFLRSTVGPAAAAALVPQSLSPFLVFSHSLFLSS